MQLVKVTRESGIPLIGHIAFGIVVRPNSNLIQVRATTICNMNCIFCSTDAGPYSKSHQNHYVVDPYYLTEWIKEIIKVIKKTKIELMFTPVWLPGINDEDIKIIIQRGKELNIPIAIQKYEEYKYSRKVKKIKKENYYKFYKQLREWEKEFTIKLIYKAEDLNVTRATNLPLVFKIGERINADIKAPGWMEGQMIAVAKKM